jgi:hypothetical protein
VLRTTDSDKPKDAAFCNAPAASGPSTTATTPDTTHSKSQTKLSRDAATPYTRPAPPQTVLDDISVVTTWFIERSKQQLVNYLSNFFLV